MTEPVELSKEEQEAIQALSAALGAGGLPVHPQMVERVIRRIARQEIASLAGLALRRTQDATLTRNPVHNEAEAAAQGVAAHFWGEVLAEYGGEETLPEASDK